jgi:hypothetical protein
VGAEWKVVRQVGKQSPWNSAAIIEEIHRRTRQECREKWRPQIGKEQYLNNHDRPFLELLNFTGELGGLCGEMLPQR